MNLGMPEMMFIFILALLIFGPKKLPEIGRQVGKALGEFKRASNTFQAQLNQEVQKLEMESKPAPPPPAKTYADGATEEGKQLVAQDTVAAPANGAPADIAANVAASQAAAMAALEKAEAAASEAPAAIATMATAEAAPAAASVTPAETAGAPAPPPAPGVARAEVDKEIKAANA